MKIASFYPVYHNGGESSINSGIGFSKTLDRIKEMKYDRRRTFATAGSKQHA
jgi:hypothetical protein